MLVLIVVRGPARGQVIQLPDEDRWVIGRQRQPGSRMVWLQDTRVSRHHADLAWRDGMWYIRDVGSSNGTAVNQQPLRPGDGWRALHDGDQIALGRTVMVAGYVEGAQRADADTGQVPQQASGRSSEAVAPARDDVEDREGLDASDPQDPYNEQNASADSQAAHSDAFHENDESVMGEPLALNNADAADAADAADEAGDAPVAVEESAADAALDHDAFLEELEQGLVPEEEELAQVVAAQRRQLLDEADAPESSQASDEPLNGDAPEPSDDAAAVADEAQEAESAEPAPVAVAADESGMASLDDILADDPADDELADDGLSDDELAVDDLDRDDLAIDADDSDASVAEASVTAEVTTDEPVDADAAEQSAPAAADEVDRAPAAVAAPSTTTSLEAELAAVDASEPVPAPTWRDLLEDQPSRRGGTGLIWKAAAAVVLGAGVCVAFYQTGDDASPDAPSITTELQPPTTQGGAVEPTPTRLQNQSTPPTAARSLRNMSRPGATLRDDDAVAPVESPQRQPLTRDEPSESPADPPADQPAAPPVDDVPDTPIAPSRGPSESEPATDVQPAGGDLANYHDDDFAAERVASAATSRDALLPAEPTFEAPAAAPHPAEPAEPTQPAAPLPTPIAPAPQPAPLPDAPPLTAPPAADDDAEPDAPQAEAAPPREPAPIADARTVVFVVDASGSQVDTLPLSLRHLEETVGFLTPNQRFTIIFFQGERVIEVTPDGLKAADESVKRQMADWIDPGSGRVIPMGASNAAAALRRAVEYTPDQLFIYSDRLVSARATDEEQQQLLTLLDELNADRTIQINTVQFIYEDPRDTLRNIAAQHHGRHTFIAPQRPVAPPPALDLLP